MSMISVTNRSSYVEAYFSSKAPSQLSDLLPEEKNFHKTVQGYSLLLKALLGTIEALENGEISLFDALVCENFCQIRALINAENVKKCSRSLISKKEHVLKNFEGLQKGSFNCCDNLLDLLAREKLEEICLTESERLCVEFFLLTFVKKENGDSEKTEYRKLQNLVEIKGYFYDNLIKKIRIRVSEISAPLLQYLALQFKDAASYNMLNEKHIRIIEKRSCPPYYPATNVVLQAVLIHGISVVLTIKQIDEDSKIIKQFCIYYEVNSTTSFKQTHPSQNDKPNPIIAIEGISKRDGVITPDIVKRHELELYLKWHGATHRQYPSFEELEEIKEDTEIQKYQRRARKWGSTIENPRLFHIRHIYCDLLKNIQGVKYKMDEYLKRYSDYQLWFINKKIKEIAERHHIDLNGVFVNGKVALGDEELQSRYPDLCLAIVSELYKNNFVMVDRDVRSGCSSEWPFPTGRGIFVDPLKLSQNYENPIKYLMDNRSKWLVPHEESINKPTNLKEIIEFITGKPDHFQEPEVMNFLADLIQAPLHDCICNVYELQAVIVGLERALDIPEVNDEALRLLLHASSNYYDSHDSASYYLVRRRSKARNVLKKFIHEPKVRRKLKMILIEEPLIQLKMELLNLLEGRDTIASELERGEIILNLSSTLKMNYSFKIRENAFNELLDLIQDESRDMHQRIVAIRYLSYYFIRDTESSFVYWESPDLEPELDFDFESELNSQDLIFEEIDSFYEELFRPDIGEHRSYRQRIFTFLTEFIKSHPVDTLIRSEASSLLFLIKSHLEYIYNDGYPILIIRKEIEEFFEKYKEFTECEFLK